jgi:demethylmenaquinone methyltransferase/2-methoxy-6-polyprenyl-1,4-benzoquinol methylase
MAEKLPAGLPVQAPHEPLTDYYAGAAQKGEFVRELFDRTAGDYDRIERILALGTGAWYRGKALERAGLVPGMRVLDVGVGTGLVAREAARIVGRAELVTGVDPSVGMMDQAQLPQGLQLVEGVAEALPFPDASFDFLSMGYALRHISDLSVAFGEFHRVLRPGGRICLLELSAPTSRAGRWLMRLYIKTLVPTLAFFVGRQKDTRRLWRYYWDTIDACAPPPRVAATLEAAGFSGVRVYNDLRGISIFSEYQGTRPL